MPSESGHKEQAESFTGSTKLKDTGSTARMCSFFQLHGQKGAQWCCGIITTLPQLLKMLNEIISDHQIILLFFFFFLSPASLGMSGDPSQTGTERLSWSFPALASRQSWNEFQDKINLDPKHCVPEDPTGISVLTLYVFSAKITDL